MGQAKLRGTYEQRVAQAIERRKAEDEKAEQARLEAIRSKHEAVRDQAKKDGIPPVMVADSQPRMRNRAALMAALAVGLAAPVVFPIERRKP